MRRSFLRRWGRIKIVSFILITGGRLPISSAVIKHCILPVRRWINFWRFQLKTEAFFGKIRMTTISWFFAKTDFMLLIIVVKMGLRKSLTLLRAGCWMNSVWAVITVRGQRGLSMPFFTVLWAARCAWT